MVFDLGKPAVRAIRSPLAGNSGGWVVPLNDKGTRVLEEYYGEPATPLAPIGNQLGYIVEPQEAADLAEYLFHEGIAWEVS